VAHKKRVVRCLSSSGLTRGSRIPLPHSFRQGENCGTQKTRRSLFVILGLDPAFNATRSAAFLFSKGQEKYFNPGFPPARE
ncbi:MAG TPA: hypothetical protein PKW95_06160, partial [bacterium]|nr:hypothetical protein [bacterium]